MNFKKKISKIKKFKKRKKLKKIRNFKNNNKKIKSLKLRKIKIRQDNLILKLVKFQLSLKPQFNFKFSFLNFFFHLDEN